MPGATQTVERLGLHLVRTVLFCMVIVLIHAAHARREAAARGAAKAFDVPLDDVRAILPDAARLGDVDPELGTRDVLNEQGERIGYVVQTSPKGDSAIGFSGPTNVLLGFSVAKVDRVAGVRVLSSGDTREHLRTVIDSDTFLASYEGRTWEEARGGNGVDAVSGATLTSLAIREAITLRLSTGQPPARSLKFPDPPDVERARNLFETAEQLAFDDRDGSVWRVRDGEGNELGSLLRTVPAAEREIGFKGPSEAFLGFDPEGKVLGVDLGRSFDNEPYVGWIRDEPWYLGPFEGRSLEEVATIDLSEEGIEGVSGATMTSMAIARGIPVAAEARLRRLEALRRVEVVDEPWRPTARDIGTTAVVLVGLVVGLTSLRGRRWVRIPFLVIVAGYLGFVNGDLVSQALLVGWARHGVPFETTAGLAVLVVAAFAVPVLSKSNVYCSHLCPFGAVQQLFRNRLPWRMRLSRRATVTLSLIPAVLLVWVVVVGMGAVTASLVDIEPFDAFVPMIAGWAALGIFAGGLLFSLFVPMAYCRFGCPTGALLGYLRYNARSDRLTIRDGLAVACVLLAVGLLFGT